MMGSRIPLFKIYWDKQDVAAVTRAIKSGRNWAIGPEIKKLETALSEYLGTKYTLLFNSGTSALHSLMIAYGFGPQDEVIVPSFTFIATANAPLFVGARPVFADIEEETFGLDPSDVKKKITSKTKAIIPVHYGGSPCRIYALKRIAKEHNLILIEDAAEAFGARIEDRRAGSFGDSAVLSFCQNKIITTGEGGAVATNSRIIYEKVKRLRSHGRQDSLDYFSSSGDPDYIELGYNFRMPTALAALGIAQLKKIDKIIKLRRAKASYLNARFNQEVREILVPNSTNRDFRVYQMYVVRVNKSRNELIKFLSRKGIMAKVYFPPVHLTHFYKSRLGFSDRLPVTEKVSEQVLSLPIYLGLKRIEMDYMVDKVKQFFKEKK